MWVIVTALLAVIAGLMAALLGRAERDRAVRWALVREVRDGSRVRARLEEVLRDRADLLELVRYMRSERRERVGKAQLDGESN
jgi:hypothetical protein